MPTERPPPKKNQKQKQGTEDDAFRAAPSPLAALSRAQRLLLLSDGSVTRHLQIVLGAAGESAAGSPAPQSGSGGKSESESVGGSSSISSVRVECLAMDLLPADDHQQPPPPPERDAFELLRPPLLRRQVLLRAAPGAAVPGPAQALPRRRSRDANDDDDDDDDTTKGPPLVYATSWWNASDAAAFLGGDGAAERPIWAALTSGRMELHRRVLGVERGANARLWSGGAGGERGEWRGLLGSDGDWVEEEGDDGLARPLWGRHYVFWAGGRPLTVISEVFSPRLMAAVDAACGIGGGRRGGF